MVAAALLAGGLGAPGEQLPLFMSLNTEQCPSPAISTSYWRSTRRPSSNSRAAGMSAARQASSLVQQHWIPAIIVNYSLCSSTLIVINKVAVHNLAVSWVRHM